MINQELLKIGQKIRNFRMRAGLSQLDLEGKIEAAPGSLSRIESGQVNPSKETLLKIVDALDLKDVEALTLFGMENEDLGKLVETSRKFNSLMIDEVMQNAVNEISYEMNLLAAAIFILEDDRVYSKTFTKTWFTDIILQLFPVPFHTMYALKSKHPDNIIVECITDKKEKLVKNFRDATVHAFSKQISDVFERIIGFKSGILIPIIDERNDEAIGAMFYTKNYDDDFRTELPILRAFTKNISSAIVNAREYEKLKKSFKN